MGRYYQETSNDSFSGKFWFGTQSSTAADRFGVQYSEPQYVNYYYSGEDLDEVTKELDRIEDWLNENNISVNDLNLNIMRQPTSQEEDEIKDEWRGAIYKASSNVSKEAESQLADYELGCMIEWTIKRYGEMSLEAEL